MNQVESAALMLAGVTLAFGAILFILWRLRRPRTAPAAPRLPRTPREPGESRLPKLSRRARPEIDQVEIAPARLARISGKAPPPPETEADRESMPPPAADSALHPE